MNAWDTVDSCFIDVYVEAYDVSTLLFLSQNRLVGSLSRLSGILAIAQLKHSNCMSFL